MSYLPELSKLTPVVDKLWVTVDNSSFAVGNQRVLSFLSPVTGARIKFEGVLHTLLHSCREGN
jgi:hypothetical protein